MVNNMKFQCPPKGLYELIKDVDNPSGNKSCKHDFWLVSKWNKGQKFVVDEGYADGLNGIRPIGTFNYLRYPNIDCANALLPNLRKLEENNYETIILAAKELYSINEHRILMDLYTNNTIDLEDIRLAVSRISYSRSSKES